LWFISCFEIGGGWGGGTPIGKGWGRGYRDVGLETRKGNNN